MLLVLPPTIAMGITFPATAALLGEERGSEGAATGTLLAVNTTGSLVATFVLPFFVIPLIGSPATLAALAIINAVVGGMLFFGNRDVAPSRRQLGAAAGVLMVLVVGVAFITGIAFRNPTIKVIEQNRGTVFEATEDEIASVEAGEMTGQRRIWVGGTTMTIITVDTKFQPLLPIALRPDAKRGLTIAFGMGTAFRTRAHRRRQDRRGGARPVRPRDVQVVLRRRRRRARGPDGHVIVADGRNHVELTRDQFDFIVVDPPPPIESSGVSVISTKEFYEASKRRLVEDGILMQWVPYGQTQDEFLAHVRSMLAVFENVNVIAGPGGYGYYMIGSDGNVELDAQALEDVLARPGVLDDVNSAPDTSGRTAADWAQTILGLKWASGEELRQVVGDGPLITDDRPLPEYFILRRLANPDAPLLSLGGLRALLP